MKIAIEARVPKDVGGTKTFLIGLVHALGQLQDGSEEYVIICSTHDPDWLKDYVGPNQRIVLKGAKPPSNQAKKVVKRFLSPLSGGSLRRSILGYLKLDTVAGVNISDGFYERLGCDLIHIAHQQFILCGLPTIYSPWDTLYLHHPQFVPAAQLANNAMLFQTGFHHSQAIIVASNWIKQDITRNFGTPPDKIHVIPIAPPIQAYREITSSGLSNTEAKYNLTKPFLLYPAITRPHKNHIRLLEALALLRDRQGLVVQLVCTGHQNPFWPNVQKRLYELTLQNQVKFLGHVPDDDLRALYHLSQAVIFPSLFEGAGLPPIEAWEEGKAIACSNGPVLVEQVENAALLFDGWSVDSIAKAVERIATDADLRADLEQRGSRRLQDFSWERTARAHRALYRQVAGLQLNEEDRHLLDWNWIADAIQ